VQEMIFYNLGDGS